MKRLVAAIVTLAIFFAFSAWWLSRPSGGLPGFAHGVYEFPVTVGVLVLATVVAGLILSALTGVGVPRDV